MDEALEKLAEDHFKDLANLNWDDFAESIRMSEARGRIAGETDSFKTSDGRWYEVSETCRWVAEREGDIEIIVEVYWDAGDERAKRARFIKRPSPNSN